MLRLTPVTLLFGTLLATTFMAQQSAAPSQGTAQLHQVAMFEHQVTRVERGAKTEPTDGLWIDGRGRLYLSAIEQDPVKVRAGNRVTTFVQDKRLRWPETISEGPDGTIYVTSARIQDMNWFKPENGPRLET